MNTIEQNENRRLNIFIQVCGLLTVFLGISAVLGWILNIPQLASFDSSKIPMAISTAVLFVAFGFITFFYKRIISNRIMFRVGVVISIIGIIIALLLLYLALKGIHPRAGHLGLGINFAVDGLIVGQMSPVTAFCFVLVGLSFLIMLKKPGQKKLIKTSLIFAVLVFFISIIFLLSYILGTPLLYEGAFIPLALTTSLAFLFLGIGLLLISGLKVWTYGELSNALSARYTYILVLVFIVLIVSIITTGYSYFKSYEKQFRFGTEQQLSSIASLKVKQIVQWRKERLNNAEFLSKNTEFSGLIKSLLKNQNDIDVKKRIQEWIDIVHSTYQYESISLHDLQGRELVTSPKRKIHSHIFFSKLLSEIQKSGEIIFKDFYRDENDLRIYLAIFIPIQFDNNLIGILDLRLDPQQYLYPLINEWPILSKTAETLIVRREGNEVVFLNDLRFQKNTALNLRRPLTKLNLPAVRAALGKKEFIESVDHRGIPVLAYVCSIPDSPWFLVARIDKSEVYAPLREWFWAIIILVVGLLFGSGASVGFVWRNQRSKFHKERFETSETLQHLSTRYEAILASVPEIIMEVDNKKNYTWSNAAGLEFFGNDVIGKDALFYFEGEQETYKSVKQIFDGSNEIVYVESWQRRKDGKKRLLAWWCKVLKDEKGAVTGALSSAQDITERKNAEEEIAMLAHALKSINECVSITDMEDKIIFVNHSFLETYGFREDELTGKHMTLVRSPNNPPELVGEILPATLLGGWHGELWNRRKDGSEFLIYLSTTLIKDKDGKSIGLIGVAIDITERKRAEKELIVAKEKAEQSDKLKTEFLSQMSHEIRTPINILLGNVEYLSESIGEKMKPEILDCFEGIDLASKRIIRTVDLILNSSEFQTSGYKPQFVKVDINSEILNKLYQEHQLTAKQKGLELIYKSDAAILEVIADEYSITQIFAHLIDNAIKYTKKGKVEILLEKNKTGNIMVEIKDTGIGMSKEYLPKLFKTFVQEEHGYSRSFDGNGLGLALVKNYCEINNATIEVESEKNVGSTFRVIFSNPTSSTDKQEVNK